MKLTDKYAQAYNTALEGLNSKQKEAVDTIEGPVLVIAGPGTGKTQILSVRIGKILQQTDANPENILCLTYTDAGAIAMRKRLSDFIGPDAYRVGIYTFHAFCNDVIQSHIDIFGKRELEPISDLENVSIIENIIDALPAGHSLKKLKGNSTYEVTLLKNLFKMMKEENWTPEKISSCIDTYLADLPLREDYTYRKPNTKLGTKIGDLKESKFNEEKERMNKLRDAVHLFSTYQQKMIALGRYDYSDMILWVVKAFSENENLLRTYQEKYLYFLVDEFQDTNGAQNEILSQLINYWDVPNIFAVGDDDQSIYAFQGARIQTILDFYNAYKQDIKIIVLTENYRSTQPILDAAKAIIENNNERLINKLDALDKNLIAANQLRIQQPETPAIYEYENSMLEQADILLQIETLKEQNFPLSEIAVIYHRHAQAENLISVFEKRNIPYQVKKRINILDTPVISQLLTIFSYLNDENHKAHSAEHNLFEIMHYAFFKLHPHDIASIAAWISSKRDSKITWREVLSNHSILAGIKLKNPEAISRFEKNITEWIAATQNLTLQILFEKIINDSGLLQYIIIHNDRNWLLEIIATFFDFIKSEGAKTPRIKIKHLLDIISQMEIHGIALPVNKTIVNASGVNFVSAHGAKGLEFDCVFLLGCTADKWEKARSGNREFKYPDTLTHTEVDANTEDIRRLFYVAMTRAKQHLYISYSKNTNESKALEPTKFISELKNKTNLQTEQRKVNPEIVIDYRIAELSKTLPVEIDLFDNALIRSKLERFEMSASALNAYLDCPIKFYFERIIKIPQAKNDSMAFGTAIHFALRRLFERMKTSENNSFPVADVFIHDFIFDMHRNEDSFTEKQYKNRLDLGKQILPDYYNKYVSSWNKVVLTEYAVRNVNLDDVPMNGIFDKIEFDGARVNVVDYKTGNVKYGLEKLNPPNEKNPLGGDYWRQILFYKILLDEQKTHKWEMISGEIDFIEKDEKKEFVKHKFYINNEHIDIVKQQILQSYKKIMNLEFTQGCGKEDCSWCNFIRENYALSIPKHSYK